MSSNYNTRLTVLMLINFLSSYTLWHAVPLSIPNDAGNQVGTTVIIGSAVGGAVVLILALLILTTVIIVIIARSQSHEKLPPGD